MGLLARPWFVWLFFAMLVILTRYPHAPGQLFSFDDVNLAYSVGHFDVRISQPQPPGYPLFVLQMRLLHLLRFLRAESILMALALAGSIASLVLLSHVGHRIFGGLTGFFAACLLVFHPAFWHSGISSALRIQLAIVSLLAAGACWRAWSGEGRWVLGSAVTLGLCAGVRPEIGPVLFPLWTVSALRAPVSWKLRACALGAMAAAVLLWLLPAMFASGGPLVYVRTCLGYLADQASETSGLFGAVPEQRHTIFWRMIAWTCCGLLAWTLPGVLAWKPKHGWGMDRDKLVFLALWLVPSFAFGVFVHIADPSQSLAMAPPIALLGGYLFQRAMDNLHAGISYWQALTLLLATLAIEWVMEFRDTAAVVVWLPQVGLAAGLLMSVHRLRATAVAILLAPVALLHFALARIERRYRKGTSAAGPVIGDAQTWNDLMSGLARALSNLDAKVSRWQTITLVLAALGLGWLMGSRDTPMLLIWLPLIALAAGMLFAGNPANDASDFPRVVAMAFMLALVVILNFGLFYFEGWYYKGHSTGGLPAAFEQILGDLNSGLAHSSLSHIKSTLGVDDQSLRQTMRLAAERPGKTVVVWEHGLVSWRKAAYYLPGVPVVVLEHQTIRSGSQAVVAIWKGPVLTRRVQGAAPMQADLPAGGRIVWLLNPRTGFYPIVNQNFSLTPAGPVYYTDLPPESGSRRLGEYQLVW